MSFSDEMTKELEKLKKKQQKNDGLKIESPYAGGNSRLRDDDDDIAPVVSFDEFLNNMGTPEEIAKWQAKKSKEEKVKAALNKHFKTNPDKSGTWFKSGAFSDGFDWSDIPAVILGTGTDVIEELAEGAMEMPERAIDFGAYLVGGAGKLLGADGFAEKTKNFIAGDLYDSEAIIKRNSKTDIILGWMGTDTEEASLLGDKSEGLANSAGQLIATKGLEMAGVPYWLTSGITSFGGEVENAFRQGASYKEAGISGLITAGAEILTEKLSGGIKFGGKALDDGLTTALARNISNKYLRAAAKFGLDFFGEGAEEWITEDLSRFGQWLTYRDDEELAELLWSEEAMEEKLDAFFGGGILGGSSNVINAVKSKRQGVDSVSGLTANEEAVVKKIYEDRVTEAAKNGKVTATAKNRIYDDVVKALEKGDISTDVIEEVLGGDTYKSYQDTVKSEDALQAELDELRKVKTSESTLEQNDRYNELKKQLDELKTTSERDFLQKKYKNEAYELAKGSKLEESYNERVRRGQAFTADVTKYNDKQRAIVQKAIDSGILNNTNKTHDFVDLVARIAGDKGVDFDFLNNEKLKESGFALDGVTVNGYFDASTKSVGINLNSAKALNTVVGHEITHVLEGTELYSELQKAVTEYAKTKGEYKSRRDALAELYKNVEGADIDAELTADLVGDYLFTDADFVNNLSANHRNIFQKIYDEVKYLCKVVTAGSKEARQLEKVKKTFEDAFRAETKNTAQEGGASEADIRYSVSTSKILSWDIAWDSNNHSSIKEQLKAHLDEVNSMQPVANVNYDKTSGKPYYEQLDEILRTKFGYKIERQDHGSITFDSKAIGGIRKYVESDAEAAAVIASPYILKRGKAISGHKNHKDKGFPSVVYAAPATLNGQVGNVAVSVLYGDAKRVHSLRVLTPNGNEFVLVNIKNTELQNVGSVTKGAVEPTISPVSNNSIPQNQKKSTQNTKKSLSAQNDDLGPIGDYNVYGEDVALEGALPDDFAPIGETANSQTSVDSENGNANRVDTEGATVLSTESTTENEALDNNTDDKPIQTVKDKLEARLGNLNTELDNVREKQAERVESLDERIADLQAQYDGKSNKDTKAANGILRSIERLKRIRADIVADYGKRISDIESRIERVNGELQKDHSKADRLERAYAKIDRQLEQDKAELRAQYESRKAEAQKTLADKNGFIKNRANELYWELSNLKKGVRASKELGYLLDHGYNWGDIKTALVNVETSPDSTVNKNSVVENVVREALNREYESRSHELDEIDAQYESDVAKLEAEAEEKRNNARVADSRKVKSQEMREQMEELVGDTSTWRDKSTGLAYKVNTLRRNLRDIVRDENGKRDVERADAIYDELQGKYNRHEAELNRRANAIRKPFADMKINKYEDVYIQMLGEFRHNPDTTLTEDDVKAYLNQHKDKINEAKVDKAIERAREVYDQLFDELNAVLREHGMKEIEYRKGYFPHLNEQKQGWLAKLFNWKTRDDSIPTDIAGLTETFEPTRSWQSFNKHRKGDTTDYSFTKGLDKYSFGALDWIYHIEDIQKRRAFENYIRYIHSDKGVQEEIDKINNNDEYSAEKAQDEIDLVYKNAANPLNNFIVDFRTATNTLAGKKSSMDRETESTLSRKIYSVVDNASKRVTANMVVGSISSALTNFIPITQSWGEVNPYWSLVAMGDTLRNIRKNDGIIEKSDFLTNRLRTAENLYKSGWDKAADKVAFLMNAVDSFTSQVVWRSKYHQNLKNGMSENAAIKNADQFAENVIAGRSRGNMPTAFDAKNPLVKVFTAFQLEVNNQYGYMFKDMPTDMQNKTKARLLGGYLGMFVGAFGYNLLYSSLTGRDAAFDPIGILMELFNDLGFGDDDEEETDIVGAGINLFDNILEETPFIGGLMGGGRIPISAAIPYGEPHAMVTETLKGLSKGFSEGDWGKLKSEWSKIIYYGVMPFGGGQLKKTVEGLEMFDFDPVSLVGLSEDHPVSGSYTDSGKLRFPVDKNLWKVVQAGLFGQYASENARDYFDNEHKALDEKQIQEFVDSGISIQDYWEYREGLSGLKTLAEKADYIYGLDIPIEAKNLFINNLSGRKEEIDLSGMEGFESFEEYDYAQSNPGKYAISKAVASDLEEYKRCSSELGAIESDKDKDGKTVSGSRKAKVVKYINDLDLDYGQKIILYRSQYKTDNTYNYEIVDYLNGRDDISYDTMVAILKELGFKVDGNSVTWD